MQLQIELFVADLDRSVAFYTGVLGFQVTRRGDGGFTEISRGGAILGLNRREVLGPDHPIGARPGERPGRGVEIVLFVEDIAAVHHDIAATGWPLSTPLTAQPWGLTDVRLLDPDGYYIRVSGQVRAT